uniref:Uncharacterized protein n=1 Tax=Arundo donax TaxID=35708 RepID=A0A0A9DKG4_ARUDO
MILGHRQPWEVQKTACQARSIGLLTRSEPQLPTLRSPRQNRLQQQNEGEEAKEQRGIWNMQPNTEFPSRRS